jgi:hypothetical protein
MASSSSNRPSGYVPFSERGPKAPSSSFNNEVSSLIEDLQRAAFRAKSKVFGCAHINTCLFSTEVQNNKNK